jgi:5-methylcytosine-specific restriction endonuclease McrA
MRVIKCAICGIEVNPNSGTQKYCKECSDKVMTQNRKKAGIKSYYKNRESRIKRVEKYAELNREKVLADKRKYYQENKDRLLEYFNDRRFDGNREEVLKRDNYMCRHCRSGENLNVHHIDGNGRTSDNPNNEIDNLITLCLSCHMQLHAHYKNPVLHRWK